MRTPKAEIKPLVIAGIITIFLFFGVIGGWSVLTTLASAAIAPGEISFDTNRKTVQHLEGGIVSEILIHDGDLVAAGDTLIRLDRTQPQAIYDQLHARYLASLTTEARLRAERDGVEELDFPDELTTASEIITGEINLFKTRSKALEDQRGIIKQRITELNEEIRGLQGEINAHDARIALLQDEIAKMQKLFEKKLVTSERLLALQRRSAEIEGDKSRAVASIARARQSISEEQLRIIELDSNRKNEVVAQLREIQNTILELQERMRAAEDVLHRTEIRAPIKGTVVDLQVNTVGGVIASRQPLMEIVPLEEQMIIRAAVQPKDIDVVRPGQAAFVRLTAFNQRSNQPIEGTVISISADRLTSDTTGLPYYLARIGLPASNNQYYNGVKIYPGMQAEVMIQVGERTPLDYLLRPIRRGFARALREE